MSTSRSTPRPTDRVRRPFAALSRYDLVLALVPIAFLLGGAASVAGAIPLRVGLAGAGALGALFVVDALFLNPPTTGTGSGVDAGDD